MTPDEIAQTILNTLTPAVRSSWRHELGTSTVLVELIFRSETLHRVYGEFETYVDEEGLRLDATIRGERIDRDRHVLDHEVKAVTRHGLVLEREGDGWLAEMILDI